MAFVDKQMIMSENRDKNIVYTFLHAIKDIRFLLFPETVTVCLKK